MRMMLETVTLKGTAKRAQLEGYTAAGKTGTAQKIDPKTRAYSHTKHVASFAGFAPVENPSVVIVVVVDEPVGAYHGGDVAAPIFREIADQILPYLGVTPDEEPEAPAVEEEERLLAQAARAAEEQRRASEEEVRVLLPEVVRGGGGEVERGRLRGGGGARAADARPARSERARRGAHLRAARAGTRSARRGPRRQSKPRRGRQRRRGRGRADRLRQKRVRRCRLLDFELFSY